MTIDEYIFVGYALLILAAPLVPAEFMVCLIFVAGTHGLAGNNAGWAGAASAVALCISAATRCWSPAQKAYDTGDRADTLDALKQPIAFLASGIIGALFLSCIWSPVRGVGIHKFGDLVSRTVLPILVIVILVREGRFDSRRMLRFFWTTAALIATSSLMIALIWGIARGGGSRLRFVGLHPLALAEISAVGCLLVLSRRELGLHPFRAYLVGAVCLGTLVLTGSKGPLLALGLAIIVVAVSDSRDRLITASVIRDLRRVAAVVVLAVVVALFAGVPLASFIPARLTPSYYVDAGGAARSQSLSSRELLWTEALERGLHEPLTGQGLGSSYQSAVQDQFTGDQLAVYPHNILLELFAEAGVVPVALLLAATATLMFRLRDRPLALGLLSFACVTATVTGGLADHRVLAMVIVAIALPYGSRQEGTTPRRANAAADGDTMSQRFTSSTW